MRRFQALLLAAGLAAAPANAAAGPSKDSWSTPQTFEKFEWSTSKGRLGVMVMGLTPELRKHLGAPADRGVLVARVESGTPAAVAGIAVGDIIVEVRGQAIDGAADVLSALTNAHKGQPVVVQVVRDKKPLVLQATLTDDAPSSKLDPKSPSMQWLRDLMRPFVDTDEPSWFHDPAHPTKPHDPVLGS